MVKVCSHNFYKNITYNWSHDDDRTNWFIGSYYIKRIDLIKSDQTPI